MPRRPSEPAPHDELFGLALGLPGAWDDHPWGDTVVKVGKKIFVFLGEPASPTLTVKLPDSAEQALMLECASPCGYGLGKWGWVTIRMDAADCPPVDVLTDWLDESYRAIARRSGSSRSSTRRWVSDNGSVLSAGHIRSGIERRRLQRSSASREPATAGLT